MKKWISFLLAAAMMLALCACGGDSYTAVPELKLSWDMDPEAAQQSCSCKTVVNNRGDGYSLVVSAPDQKLPKVAGVPLSTFTCVFENDRMIQVILTVNAYVSGKDKIETYNYKKVVELFTEEYGRPSESISKSANPMDPARTVWILDGRAIEIQGNLGMVQKIVFYANTAEETLPEETAEPAPVPAEPAEAASEPETGDSGNENEEVSSARIVQDMAGSWISANDIGCELTVFEDGTFSFAGQSYHLTDMYELEGSYVFHVEEDYRPSIFWVPKDKVIFTSGLPGQEDYDSVYFYREGELIPGEPFFGTWTLSKGRGLTWEGTNIQTITVTPEGGLVLDAQDIGLTLVLYPDSPGYTSYRWVINRHGDDGGYFGIFLETPDPFTFEQDTFLIIDNVGRSYYQRS